MPGQTIEIPKSDFRKRMDIIRATLSLVKGKLSKSEYAHVKRLITDGTERDLIFMQGLATGMELAALDKKSTDAIIDIFRLGVQRAKKGELSLLNDSDLNKIDELMKRRFPLGARKKMLSIIERGDAIMFDGLIEMLKKVA